ncbi:MAG: hypothetical protein BGN88_05780 [Clostridiales bacterium 43-6]|nr:MAG: hypothetical protein BGN88_05780 [Clostridiales bacterium 43-6]
MKRKGIFTLSPIIITLIALILLLSGVTYFLSLPVFIAEIAVSLGVIAYTVYRMKFLQTEIHNYFNKVIKGLENAGSDSLSNFVLPVLVTNDSGDIVWYNELFRESLLQGQDKHNEPSGFLFDETAEKSFQENRRAEISYDGREYTVFEIVSGTEVVQKIYYFYDNTRLKHIEQKFKNSQLSVIYILIDSLEVLLKNAKESEKAAIIGAIEQEIENVASETDGFFHKLSSDRYVLIVDEQAIAALKNTKFEVLSKVRGLVFGERGGTTLSIGIGRGGSTIHDCVEIAQAALDMALGRGGDQAVIKTNDNFEFYGGVSQGVEKSSRVRTRVIASALQKLIESSDNVLIMGHRFSDYDSFGASFALWRAAKELEKPSYVVLDKNKTLSTPLIERVESKTNETIIIDSDTARSMMTKKTLLIIVDTHRAEFLESKEIYDAAKTVIVIDHHRKNVDFIDDAVIFYHEPFASSACELTAELLQYMNPRLVGRTEAEALFAGIMLDTRNFVLRTGVKTFEASAFLRSRGADPVEVKRMFSGSMESYRERAEIVAAADIIFDCAVSLTDEETPFMRVACAQAADELLSISGINASFVLFPTGNLINISARSLGGVNVQIVMEQLGGGGHQTMAAAQLEGHTIDSAKALLIETITKIKSEYETMAPQPARKE